MPRIPEAERRFLPAARDAMVPNASRLALVVAEQTDRAAEMEYALKATAEQTEIDNTLLKLKTDIELNETKHESQTNPQALINDSGADLDDLATSVRAGASSARVRDLMAPQVAANVELAQARVNRRARTLTIDNAKSSIDTSMQQLAREAALARDPLERTLAIDQFNVTIAAHEGLGSLKPTEATNYLQTFQGSIDQYQVDEAIADDPYAARNQLDDPDRWTNLTDSQRRTAMRTADARIDQIERRAIAAQTHADAVAAREVKAHSEQVFDDEVLPAIQKGVTDPDGTQRQFTVDDLLRLGPQMTRADTVSALSLLRQPKAIQTDPATINTINDMWDKGEDASEYIADAAVAERFDSETHLSLRQMNRSNQGGVRNWALNAETDIAKAMVAPDSYSFISKRFLADQEREAKQSLRGYVRDAPPDKPRTQLEIDDFTEKAIEKARKALVQRPVRLPQGNLTEDYFRQDDPEKILEGLKIAKKRLQTLRLAGRLSDSEMNEQKDLFAEWERYARGSSSKTVPEEILK